MLRYALTSAVWNVVVLEKSSSPQNKSVTGAGLGLDSLSCSIIDSWLRHPNAILNAPTSLAIDQAIKYGFGERGEEDVGVKVRAKVVKSVDEVEFAADLLVGADGCLSSIRQKFLPEVKLMYSGYCAWSGVLDCSKSENLETYLGIKKAYPELGQCLYFDLGPKTHLVVYELAKKRINWIWYVNRPEVETKGTSVTTKVSDETIQNMHKEAEKIWVPEMTKVIKDIKEPFINVIYDSDPMERIVWNNMVLIGDAAHPTTPHGLRSTNMSNEDAATLGKCIAKRGSNKLQCALEEYQSIRVPVTSKQVLHSRRLGRIKQGLELPDCNSLKPRTVSSENSQQLLQKNMPFFVDSLMEHN